MSKPSIYRSPEGEAEILRLYDRGLLRAGISCESRTVATRYGDSHLLVTGPEDAPPLMLFHGGNVVNPLTLEWFGPLSQDYRIYAPDTVGHPGRSAQTRISSRDDSYGKWAVDVLDGLELESTPCVGPSFGAGIILRAAAYAPERIAKAALLLPSGIASGSLLRMTAEVAFPMLLYRALRRRALLVKAVRPMFTEPPDEYALELCGAVFRNVKIETQMPKHATAEELARFQSPTLVIAAENDIFFPADAVIPKAEKILPNLVATERLAGSSHYPSRKDLEYINRRVREFLREDR